MNRPIDIIIPVYRGLKDVQDCLNSVYEAKQQTPYELIVIDDCSPEPEVSAYLKEEAKKGLFTLLINEVNLGFVATVNRGMQLHTDRDVLLLNSDTIVANDWLDRIFAAAYADDRVGTVTPFSNNATICSYPTFCQDNQLPSNTSLTHLDTLFAFSNRGQAVDIPTGVGFCMYITRGCLDEVGYFDVETFGKGYGEENDFCQRAIKADWKNRFTLDTFVQHTGNVSFGDEHNDLKHGALGKLAKRHPHYERDVHRHIAEDPAKSARVATWLASLLHSEQPIVVHVTHNRGGGTLRFVEELSKDIKQAAYSLMLMPSTQKPGYLVLTPVRVSNEGLNPIESEYSLYFEAQNQQRLLLSILKQLPLTSFHFHHMLGLPDWLMNVPKQLDLPWFVALHDFYFACDSISLTDSDDMFKGQSTEAVLLESGAALDDTPARQQWRQRFVPLLEGATRCFAPSRDSASRLKYYFPKANIVTQYHQQARHFSADFYPAPIQAKRENETLNVIVIGALSRIKGADLLEKTALLCKQHNINVDFELIGYGYRDLITKGRSNLHVHGRYQESELPSLLESRKAEGKADLVWFTALWPETYSYTLSSAIEAKLPILAPNVGAFSERLFNRPESWIIPWTWQAEEVTELFRNISKEGSSFDQLETLKSTIEAAKQDFSYRSDYLSLCKKPDIHPIAPQKLANWLQKTHPLLDGKPTFKQALRKHLLNTLYYLRSAPILRPIARCIPQRLQRRVKDRLSK
jgi:GT2 family glycosyltransferase